MPRPVTSIAVCLALSATLAVQAVQIQWANERLSVQADGAPLKDVIEALAKRSGIVTTGADRRNGRVSIEFRDKPLAEGLALLLEGANYVVTRQAGVVHVAVHSM